MTNAEARKVIEAAFADQEPNSPYWDLSQDVSTVDVYDDYIEVTGYGASSWTDPYEEGLRRAFPEAKRIEIESDHGGCPSCNYGAGWTAKVYL